MGMDGTSGELPPMNDAVLDEEQLKALFRDLRALAQVDEIIVKDRPGMVEDAQRVTLDEAERMLSERSVRGVQVRYRHGGAHWFDTLMPVDSGVRLVRIRHEFESEAEREGREEG